jgi:hypothetical protein
MALINWCIEAEHYLVAGATNQAQAQDHIEEQVESMRSIASEHMKSRTHAKPVSMLSTRMQNLMARWFNRATSHRLG